MNDVLTTNGALDLEVLRSAADVQLLPHDRAAWRAIHETTAEIERLRSKIAQLEGEEGEEEDRNEWRPFPTQHLPTPAARYVTAAAKAVPVDPAMIAVPALTALSAAIGSAARIRLKRSWHEPATIWTGIVAPSGSAKSPALHHALRPIYEKEKEAAEAFRKALKKYEREERGERPTRRRFRVGDSTVEAVASVLAENPRGVLLARDEQAGWFGGFDQYKSGDADLQSWLEMHAGRPISVDRKSSPSLAISDPAVPVTGTIQPGTLRDRLAEIHFDSGFAARLLLVMPPAEPKRWTEADVTREVRDGYRRLLDRMYAIEQGTVVRLSNEALELFAAFANSNAAETHALPESPRRAVSSKTEMHAARLALILHSGRVCAGETGRDEVEFETMRRAIYLARWFRREAYRVYDALRLDTAALPPDRQFLKALPTSFKTADAEKQAAAQDVSRSTAFRWLSDALDEGRLKKPKRGTYRKTDLT